MKYLENNTIKILLDNAVSYRKKAVTLLRKPLEHEIDSEIITYVKDNNGEVRIESISILTKDKILAKNPGIIGNVEGKDIYNEWPISNDVVIKNYGKKAFDDLNFSFQPFQKIATVKAIKLTKNILEVLNSKNDELEITVDWSDKPMIAKIGDYITNQGYSISSNDMKDYEKVKED